MKISKQSRGRLQGRRVSAAVVAILGFGWAALGSGACGARSSLYEPPPRIIPKCLVDADCPGFDNKCRNVKCLMVPAGTTSSTSSAGGNGGATSSSGSTTADVTSTSSTGGGDGGAGAGGLVAACVEGLPVDCDDGDECTTDKCDKASGECEHTHVTVDLDGDKHYGPLEGHAPGDPGSCGDDCDDTNPNAYPGFPGDPCDGVDNNCNGIIDDGAIYLPTPGADVRISDTAAAEPGGLSWNGKAYWATYSEPVSSGKDEAFDALLSPSGDKSPPGPTRITNGDSPSFAGPNLWVGDRFGVVWEETRDDAYDIFFTEFDENRTKILPDVKLTHTAQKGFSIYPSLAFTGQHFISLWQNGDGDAFQVIGQKINLDGTLAGDQVQITADTSVLNESPSIAASSEGVAVAYSADIIPSFFIEFQMLDFDLKPTGNKIDLTDGTTRVKYPQIVFSGDRYVVAWQDETNTPPAIYAAAIDLKGNLLVPAKPISHPPPGSHSRTVNMRGLGDRVVFVYADDRDGNKGYELYTTVVDNDLKPISTEHRITNAAGNSSSPVAAFGPDGNLGVLFLDERLQEQDVWFTRLTCSQPTDP